MEAARGERLDVLFPQGRHFPLLGRDGGLEVAAALLKSVEAALQSFRHGAIILLFVLITACHLTPGREAKRPVA